MKVDATERRLTKAYNEAVRKFKRNTDPLKTFRLAEQVTVALRRLNAYKHQHGK